MAGRVSIRVSGVVRAELVVRQPRHHVVLGNVGRIRGNETFCLRPEVRNTLGRIKQVDGKTVSDVVVLHVPENIVVDIAEVLHLGLHTPVVAVVLKDRMLVEHAAVPSAHQMVGHLVAVLDALLLEHLCRLVEKVHIDPVRDLPMFLRDLLCIRSEYRPSFNMYTIDHTIEDLCLCLSPRPPLELLCERHIVEEDPRVVELAVPGSLQIAHRRNQFVHLFVSDQGNECGIGTGRVGAVRGIVVVVRTP